jgi:arylsulfatase A-like enzyme
MAQRGTHFNNFFTCQPVCGPARSCLQTGRFATQTGVYRNGLPLTSEHPTLADCFNGAGYETGYIGKWHLGDSDEDGPVEPALRGGYRHWLAANALEMVSDAYDARLYDEEGREVRLPGYRVDALTDAAIRFVDKHAADPFLLCLSFLEPHHQNSRNDYPAPDGYEERYRGRWIPPDLAALAGSAHRHLAGYYGMVKRLDEALGRLLDALRSSGILEETVVLFLSDHGNHFCTRNAEYKRSLHDSSIRVPCAAVGPGFNGGGRVQHLTSIVDVAPTLLDAAGLPVPASMSGRSAMPLLRKENVDWPEEVFVQISESHVGRAVRTGRWKYGVAADEADPVADSGAEAYKETHLYDLFADPYELDNLIGLESHARVAEVMRERLMHCMRRAGEAPPEIDLAEALAAGQRKLSDTEALQ